MIHSAAAAGYEAGAGGYEGARPEYDRAAVDLAVEVLGLRPGRVVLDVAAGTGKWTRLLVPTGATVLAMEPVAAMRRELTASVPGASVLAGTAEALPLADASTDAVTVASAIHWFRRDEALGEMHRVLRPAGLIAFVRNTKDTSVPWVAEYDAIVARQAGDTPRPSTMPWREVLSTSPLFSSVNERGFPTSQRSDADWLVARTLSVSFIAALSPAEQSAVVQQVRDLARQLPDEFDFPYVTEVQWGERRGGRT